MAAPGNARTVFFTVTLISAAMCVIMISLMSKSLTVGPANYDLEIMSLQHLQDNISSDFRHEQFSDNYTAPTMMTSEGRPVTLVHLLSYQRSGSSFLGGVIHTHPQSFYVYEPIDMLYSALVGITPGMTVPADMLFSKDGTLRKLPPDELFLSQWTIEKIFRCEMSTFPTAMLIHAFWHMFKASMPDVTDYVTCLTRKGIHPGADLRHCQHQLRGPNCPNSRYLRDSASLTLCKNVLWNNGRWYSNQSTVQAELDKMAVHVPRLKRPRSAEAVRSGFRKYFSCLSQHAEAARKCARDHLDAKCANSYIRGVKTVRTPMEVAANLLRKYPDFKVIHLVRDPRGATRSRTKAVWSHGLGEKNSIPAHADKYCRPATSDYKLLQSLKTTFINRTLSVVYDGFVENPKIMTSSIYSFLRTPVKSDTKKWLDEKSRGKIITRVFRDKYGKRNKKVSQTNSSTIATAWKSFYNHGELESLKRQCAEFYKIVQFPWIL